MLLATCSLSSWQNLILNHTSPTLQRILQNYTDWLPNGSRYHFDTDDTILVPRESGKNKAQHFVENRITIDTTTSRKVSLPYFPSRHIHKRSYRDRWNQDRFRQALAKVSPPTPFHRPLPLLQCLGCILSESRHNYPTELYALATNGAIP